MAVFGEVIDMAWVLFGSSVENSLLAVENGRAAIYAAFTKPDAAAFCAPMVLMVDEQGLHKQLFGRNMARGRHLAGNMSQDTLAALVGVERRVVNRWERGHREPRGARRLQIAQALGQPLEFFYDEIVLEEADS